MKFFISYISMVHLQFSLMFMPLRWLNINQTLKSKLSKWVTKFDFDADDMG